MSFKNFILNEYVNVSFLNKYRHDRIKYSEHFKENAIERKLTEREFSYIMNFILDNEDTFKLMADQPEEQYYLVYSTKMKRALVINYLVKENRIVVWTVLPTGKFKISKEKEHNTVRIIFENKEMCGIIPLKID